MDTSKSQATNTISYHGSYTYQKFTGSKKVILPCLTHIPANHRKKSYIVPCLRYQQITGNKAHLLCLSRKLANHRQQIVHLPIASHKCQQHTGNTSHILQCFFLQVPENQKPSCQQIVYLAMPHADTSKSRQQIVNLPCLRQIANQGKQIVHLTMPHTVGSKSQATNHTPTPGSHRHQQHTSNKSHGYQQITGNKYYVLPWLIHIPEIHGQQKGHLAMPHTYTSKSQEKIVHRTMPQIQANHKQQSTLAMPFTETCKSQATNRTSSHASHRYQQITGNKSCILQCFIQIPENHRPSCQQIVHLAMPHADTSKSQ